MWTYHPDLLATPVPRYTSYPTAAEFHEGVGATDQAEGLASITAEDQVSIYLHIPYCREICWYCGCNTGAANRIHRLDNYLDRLRQEIALVSRWLGGRAKVARIAFGGGSPNAISPDQFRALCGEVRAAFDIAGDAVWSVELDPRGFDQPFADALADMGVVRASLGVQTFDEEVQRSIGRIQPLETIGRTTEMLRSAGINSLNFDLMYGLPGQDDEMLNVSLGEALRLGADRLAVFGYAHVPHMLPRQRRIDASRLPDAEARFRQAELAHHVLTGAGLAAVGFDHFARSSDPMAEAARDRRVRRNFQGFTDDPCDTLIGLGASSISRFGNALIQNERNSGSYGLLVGNGRLAGARGIATSAVERRRGAAIERLLCDGAADLIGLADIAAIRQAMHPFEERSLIDWSGTLLQMRPDALPYARSIAARLDPWRNASPVTFSSAV